MNRFKHDGRLECGHLLASLLADTLSQQAQPEETPWPEVLLPVPLHWRRLCSRGYNQSLEIAKVVGQRLNLPICHNLQRQRSTTSQQQLGRAQRKLNLEEAFTLRRPMNYRHIALIDDVITTGSTVNAISNHLKEQGVLTIHVWAIARTPQ